MHTHFLEFNENEGRAYLNPWATMKAVLKGKFIAPVALERNYKVLITTFLKILPEIYPQKKKKKKKKKGKEIEACSLKSVEESK